MTDHQIRVAQALALCTFLTASDDKRFARDMANRSPDLALSERQALHLERLAWRYRRQMPADLVPAGQVA
jgi:hypothetical protein